MLKNLQKILSHQIARLISTIFVPPSFTLLVFIFFAFRYENDPTKILAVILTAFVFGFAALIVMFFILRSKKLIADSDASIKEERTFPFIVAIGFYIIGLLLLLYFEVQIISFAFWFCYISNTIITIIINKFWKISAHSMGVSGAMAALFVSIGTGSLFMLILVALIGWARIKLKCHTFMQVAAGILLAFFSTLIQMNLIINYW